MSVLYIAMAILILTMPEACSEAAELSLTALKCVVVKTLFPMMVLTRLISHSRGFSKFTGLLSHSFLWRRLRLSDSLLGVVITGWVSGLPSSAKSISELKSNGVITQREADKALALSSIPSPAFVIAVASKSLRVGIVRFIVLILVAYFVALCLPSERSEGRGSGGGMSFVNAISGSASSAILVSGNIVFFSLASTLLSALFPIAKEIIYPIFEMGSGVVFASGKEWIIALSIGWCGVSAMLQLHSEAPQLSLKPYIITRIISAFILVLCEKIL